MRRIPCNHTPEVIRFAQRPERIRRSRDKTRNTLMVDPRKATKGRRMSKKTRKKSSKPAPKSRKTPARKPAAAKTAAAKTTAPQRHDAGQKAGQPRPPASRPNQPPRRPSASPTSGQNRSDQSVAQAAIETVKIQSPAAAPNRFREPTWSRARRRPPSACPATAATMSRWPTMRARNWCCSSIPAPTPRAAPGRRSISRGSRARLPKAAAAVLGVSADTVKAQESFRDKHQLSVPLISDEQHEMLEAYGAWGEKSMYGRNFMGIIRTRF